MQDASPDIRTQVWEWYHRLLLSPDIERIRKLLVRYDLFKGSLPVPRDIVECGVLKGAGSLYWLKLLHSYAPGGAKRVMGFDAFCGSRRIIAGDYVAASRIPDFTSASYLDTYAGTKSA